MLGSDLRKFFYIYVHIYILGPKLLQLSFLQIFQLSIWSGAHKLFRRFLDFSHFFDHNFSKIVAPPNDGNENYVVHLKELSLLKKNGVNIDEIGE